MEVKNEQDPISDKDCRNLPVKGLTDGSKSIGKINSGTMWVAA